MSRPPRIAYVLPTRDRADRLAATLDALSALPPHDAQVIVVDNASRIPPPAPVELANGVPVTLLLRSTNEGAAARNAGVAASDPSCEWIVMLDDDSHPLDLGHLSALRDAPADAAAVGAEILLSDQNRREAGGLPEVFVGCGVAIRRGAFLEVNAPGRERRGWEEWGGRGEWGGWGYDPAFNYYVEEYDLSARLLLAGWRVTFDGRFRVLHHKVGAGRDMNAILRRLVRNNGWIAQRYAPRGRRWAELRETLARYARIAHLERAEAGYLRGLGELLLTLPRQPRTPMPPGLFDRFTGRAHARQALGAALDAAPFATAALLHEGKNASHIRAAAAELGITLVSDPDAADRLIIGTLSPGPMLDAWDAVAATTDPARIVLPWLGALDGIKSRCRAVAGAA